MHCQWALTILSRRLRKNSLICHFFHQLARMVTTTIFPFVKIGLIFCPIDHSTATGAHLAVPSGNKALLVLQIYPFSGYFSSF